MRSRPPARCPWTARQGRRRGNPRPADRTRRAGTSARSARAGRGACSGPETWVYRPPEIAGGNPSLYLIPWIGVVWRPRLRQRAAVGPGSSDPGSLRLNLDPRLRDEQLLVEAHRITVGHAGKEVHRGGVQPFLIDRAPIEELGGALAHLLPEPAENPTGFLELRGRDVVLVNRLEKKAAQPDGRLEDPIAHTDLGEPAIEALHDDIGDHAADALRGALAEHRDTLARQILFLQQPRSHRIVDVVIHIGDDVRHAGDLPLDSAGAVFGIGAHGHPALPFRMARDAVAHFPRQV